MPRRVVEQFFSSPEAMAMTPGLLTPMPWPDWTARMRSLDVEGARADYVEIGPYRLDVPPARDRPDVPLRMMLTVILEGSSVSEVDGRPLTLSSRQAALIDGRAAMHFHAPEPVRAVRIFVDHDRLPSGALSCRTLPFARLKHTPLVTACVGFITGLLQVNDALVRVDDEAAVSRPLIALMTSLLDEGVHSSEGRAGDGESPPITRREQIEAYVEQHLAEPDLSVASIAVALGLSVRTLHGAYEDGPDTVAARIRARRLARAQMITGARAEPPHLGLLAARVGLNPEQLTRAFRASTGLTPRQWWAQHGPTAGADGMSRG